MMEKALRYLYVLFKHAGLMEEGYVGLQVTQTYFFFPLKEKFTIL